VTSLITGANGFIGRRLVQPGDRGLMRNLTALPSSVRGDLLDFSSLASACEGDLPGFFEPYIPVRRPGWGLNDIAV
jgi:hypothetical protein